MCCYFEVAEYTAPTKTNTGTQATLLFGLKITQKSAFLMDFQNFYYALRP